ncbi:MAG: DUF4136 domain-containing protein [Verrucomicrobiota bacterium]|nr:DUF4136 domain-containing protein [Verrucomicrobiota bacterium]MCC6821735.1 DUF4136 domain-containing protein [Limisphaerales bacterium]
MRITLLLPVVLTGLLAAGCSSTPKRVNSGPLKAHTFSFVNGGTTPAAAAGDKREALHLTIQDAITQDLTGKGMAKVATGGDVTVAYLIIVGNNATTEAISTYFGAGRDASGLSDKAHAAYTENKNPNYFEAGTLVVDIIDAKTYKVLYRNFEVQPLLRNPSTEVRAANIQAVVNDVLGNLQRAR